MTKPISIRLEESVIHLLKEQSQAAGLSQADYLSRLICSNVAPPDIHEKPASSFNDPARAERKAARVERKAALQESVTQALPARAVAAGEYPTYTQTRPHSFHSGHSPVAGCGLCQSEVEWLKKQKK